MSEARTVDEAWAQLSETERQTYEAGWQFILDMKQYGRECLERNDGACVVERDVVD